MNPKDFNYLVRVGVNAYDFVANIGAAIREAAHDDEIAMTETEFCNILIQVHQEVRS